ncbi:MAG TPA: zf-HC2 domain-containing protein, partial [Pyrinomonadaceae bacterium]|nr:zf-HC2 domain-containing protein [Pyrinomonadaceae bacterium]
MTCEETQKLFSPFLDGELSGSARAAAGAHLAACPVCRARLDATREVVRGLAMLERPAAPADLVASINDALLIERAARASRPALSPSVVALLVGRWVRPRVMPYTVGAFASVLLFFAVFSALRPQIAVVRELAIAARSESLDDIARDGGYDVT